MKQPFTDKSKVLVPKRWKRLEMDDATRLLVYLDGTEIQLQQPEDILTVEVDLLLRVTCRVESFEISCGNFPDIYPNLSGNC